MTRTARALLVLAALAAGAVATACSGNAAGSGRDPNRISFEEIQAHGQYSNLYDLVEILRPRWLREPPPDTFQGTSGQVQVHMDGNRMGDVAVLRSLSQSGVTSIRWMGPIDAAARFGLDHGHGAIIISTRPIH